MRLIQKDGSATSQRPEPWSDERDWQKLSPNGLAFSLEPFAMQAKTPARLKPSVGLTAGGPAGRRAWVEVSARGIICCETLWRERSAGQWRPAPVVTLLGDSHAFLGLG